MNARFVIFAGIGAGITVAAFFIHQSVFDGPGSNPDDPASTSSTDPTDPDAPANPADGSTATTENDAGTNAVTNDTDPVDPPPLDDAAIAALLVEHEDAFRKGDFEKLKTLETKLAAGRPLSCFDSFSRVLAQAPHFGYRDRLLALLEPTERELVWELFLRDLDRYGKGRGLDWQEGEQQYLWRLAALAAPSAWMVETGMGVLQGILFGTTPEDLKTEIVAALENVEAQGRKEYLLTLERLLGETDESVLKRAVALTLLRFSLDQASRRLLLDRPTLRRYRGTMLAICIDEKLISREDAIQRVREVLAAGTDRHLATLFRSFAGLAPEEALSTAREQFQSSDISSDFRAALMTTLAALGGAGDLEMVAQIAAGAGAEARAALNALAEAGHRDRVARVFESGQSAVTKAGALRLLAKGEDRQKWIERGLGADQVRAVRVAACSLLDPAGADQPRLLELAESDIEPAVRERALKTLGGLDDQSLRPFFESRAMADGSAALRNLASGYAARLKRLLGVGR